MVLKKGLYLGGSFEKPRRFAMAEGTKGMLKVPLIIAAAVVVLRVVLEQLGSPDSVNQIFGVAWLYFVIPVYLAFRISGAGVTKPYLALLKNLLLFIICTRLIILPTYWLAYAFQWGAGRFTPEHSGNVAEGVSPFAGYLGIPLQNGALWIVMATIVGMIIGGVTLLIRRWGAK
jgi:hypothetical protein